MLLILTGGCSVIKRPAVILPGQLCMTFLLRVFPVGLFIGMVRPDVMPLFAALLAVAMLSLGSTTEHDDVPCSFPQQYIGSWFSTQDEFDLITNVTSHLWGEFICAERHDHPISSGPDTGIDSTLLVEDRTSGCRKCLVVFWRSQNVLQTKTGDCIQGAEDLPCRNQPLHSSQLVTLFAQHEYAPVSCPASLSRVYHLTYEVSWGGGGLCDDRGNHVSACQDLAASPSPPEVQGFHMTFDYCYNKAATRHLQGTNAFRCLASWDIEDGGQTFQMVTVGLENPSHPRTDYRCLITDHDPVTLGQEPEVKRWGMSRFADCRHLHNGFSVPIRLVMKPGLPLTRARVMGCSLPDDLFGYWQTRGADGDVRVYINGTHIQLTSGPQNQISYLACQQNRGDRYLVSKYKTGQCDVELGCVELSVSATGDGAYRLGGGTVPIQGHDDFMHVGSGPAAHRFDQVCTDQSFEDADQVVLHSKSLWNRY